MNTERLSRRLECQIVATHQFSLGQHTFSAHCVVWSAQFLGAAVPTAAADRLAGQDWYVDAPARVMFFAAPANGVPRFPDLWRALAELVSSILSAGASATLVVEQLSLQGTDLRSWFQGSLLVASRQGAPVTGVRPDATTLSGKIGVWNV